MHGRLDLEFVRGAEATTMRVRRHAPPLQVVRAFQRDRAALVQLHNVSGGILGGDCTETAVEVRPGAHAVVKTAGATRLYRARQNDEVARQKTFATVAEAGILEWLPELTIPYAGSATCCETRIELADDAGLFWWDILGPGRLAHGEAFEYRLYEGRLDLIVQGRCLAKERFALEPGCRSLSGPAVMNGCNYVATMYLCRAGASKDRLDALEAELREALKNCPATEFWGASALAAAGVVVKGLAASGSSISRTLHLLLAIGKKHLAWEENAIASHTA